MTDDAARIREAVRRGYDRRAPEFGRHNLRRHRDARLDLPAVPAGATVLDVGCGTGRSTAPLLAPGIVGPVIGLDLSRGMLSRARQDLGHHANLHLVQADAERLPLRSNLLDVVVSRRALSHLADQTLAFAEIARVLRAAGAVDLTLFGDQAMDRPIERHLAAALHDVVGDRAQELVRLFRPPSIAAVDAAAHAAGLEASDLRATTTYAWDDADRLVDGLLVATTYLRSQLTSEESSALAQALRRRARAAASPRGLADWSYEIHFQGRQRTS